MNDAQFKQKLFAAGSRGDYVEVNDLLSQYRCKERFRVANAVRTLSPRVDPSVQGVVSSVISTIADAIEHLPHQLE